MSVEDVRVLARALDDHPEYFQFWLELRDRQLQKFLQVPNLKSEADVTAYGLQCYGLAREVGVLTKLIEMPLQARKALNRAEEKMQRPADEGRPWDPTDEEEE